jgi:protein involved in polysaccharide export with SLBB domain
MLGQHRNFPRDTMRTAITLLFVLLLGIAPGAFAQGPGTLTSPPSLPGLPPGVPADAVQRALSALGGRMPVAQPGGGTAAPQLPSVQPEMPSGIPQPQPADPLSEIERFYNERLPAALPRVRQFGYETLTAFGAILPQAGAALAEDYVLGPDDELAVTWRGRVRNAANARVDRDGRVILPDISPVPAAGRTLREFRADLEARVARELPGTEVFVSIAAIRQITVFVGGEVNRPGLHQATSLSSLLDALALAGGVKRTGSLRSVQVISANRPRSVDLYGVLTGSAMPDLSLRAGDRVLVPAIGPTLAIVGDVPRAGIYEFLTTTQNPTLSEVLNLAGGALRPAGNRFTLFDYDAAGRRTISEIRPFSTLKRGDLVTVGAGAGTAIGQVRLAGHVVGAESRARTAAPTLRQLIGDPRNIRPDPYSRMVVIARTHPTTRDRQFVGFDLGSILSGRVNERLRDEDEVLILSVADVQFLSGPMVQRALLGQVPSVVQGVAGTGVLPDGVAPALTRADECPALVQLALTMQGSPMRFPHAAGFAFSDTATATCPPLFREFPDLLTFLLDNAIAVTGEVARPGLYPVPAGVGLDAVVAAAGGLTRSADLASIELSRQPLEGHGGAMQPLERRTLDIRSGNLAAVRLGARDSVRIPRGFSDRDTGPVRVLGEVMRPGTYDIKRGERLSDVLARAGGLTQQAYAFGAVFTRESARARQQEGFSRAAREIETALMTMAAGSVQPGAAAAGRGGENLGDAIRAGRELAQGLRATPAAGRMVIEANPAVLVGRPDLDILLEPGDLLVVPKRPSDVAVVGTVLNPGTLQFTSGQNARDYVRAAGGLGRFADADRTFVVLPNGTARPARITGWNLSTEPVPPGSLVVVPQDPAPYETWGMIRDLTGVFTQVAISAAALAVIAREAK